MRRSCLLLVLLAACGDDAATPDATVVIPDAEPGIDADPEMPGTLRDTGLYSDWDRETIAEGVYEFAPEYALWSDGATKRRWIYLPEGEQVDTSDMDYWKFPEGTKVWKEFTRDGTRVETRLLQKIGPADTDWFMVAFAWNEAQDEAIAQPFGVENALDTGHNIPSRSDCRKCHDRLPSRVLGFSAIALDHASSAGVLALSDAIANDLLSDPPTGADPFALPGAPLDQDALGYLHINCGGCHNAQTDISTVSVHFRLEVGGLASVAATTTAQTAFGQAPNLAVTGATSIIEEGDHEASAAWIRMSSTNASIMMPPVGHLLVDDDNAQVLADWIDAL